MIVNVGFKLLLKGKLFKFYILCFVLYYFYGDLFIIMFIKYGFWMGDFLDSD